VNLPEDTVFGTWYYLSFKIKFLKVVPGTKCSSKMFQKFLRSKNEVFRPVQIPKIKTLFEFFHRFLGDLEGKKVVLFGFCNGTKCEKLNFYSSNILNSPLVPVLSPKSTTFTPLVSVLSPQEIDEKNSKKVFFGGICTGPNTLFLDLKNI
jgi:hypothetical protein